MGGRSFAPPRGTPAPAACDTQPRCDPRTCSTHERATRSSSTRCRRQPATLHRPRVTAAPAAACIPQHAAVAFVAVGVCPSAGTEVHDDVVSRPRAGGGSFSVEDESPTDGSCSPETVGGCTGRLLLIVDDPFGHRFQIGHPVHVWRRAAKVVVDPYRSLTPATPVPVRAYPEVRAVVAFSAAGFACVEQARSVELPRSQAAIGGYGAVIVGGAAGDRRPGARRSRCRHPGQQQGRRRPSCSSSHVRRTRRARVSGCLASSTQQMNSLRASGVMSLHAARAVASLTSASRRSAGSSCTTPPGTCRSCPLRRGSV